MKKELEGQSEGGGVETEMSVQKAISDSQSSRFSHDLRDDSVNDLEPDFEVAKKLNHK
jgi:hypothetical protein